MVNSVVLVVSTDAGVVSALRAAVAAVAGCHCVVLDHVDQALEFLVDSPASLCIYHATEESRHSLEWLLKDLRVSKRREATLVISDDERPEAILRFLEFGIADCLALPLDQSRLKFLIDSLTFRARHVPNQVETSEELVSLAIDSDPLFQSSGSGRLAHLVRKAARQDATVLLTGETGVGKTRLSRVIHNLSPRRAEPFLTVNCASLSENLLESELFGHCKGSFTGADVTRIGRFEAAGKGTLLLDEVDSLPLTLQKKLLRAVDERMFEPVGSNVSQPFNARLIVATNRNLTAEIAAGTFRSDLYYRLNIIELTLPPLRLRRHAIRAIAEGYLQNCATRNHRPVPKVAPDVWEALVAFDWPGNIRELRNTVERALALCDERKIVLDDLPDSVQACFEQRLRPGTEQNDFVKWRVDFHTPVSSVTPPVVVEMGMTAGTLLSPLAKARAEAEIQQIVHALHRAGNNRTKASAELGISRVALYKKLRQFGILDFSIAPAT
jgi:DNA-binding NtrC family response regulator